MVINQEGIIIWIYLVRLNVLDRRVGLPEGRTSAPLKFRLFCQNFLDLAKVGRTCVCGDFQL